MYFHKTWRDWNHHTAFTQAGKPPVVQQGHRLNHLRADSPQCLPTICPVKSGRTSFPTDSQSMLKKHKGPWDEPSEFLATNVGSAVHLCSVAARTLAKQTWVLII